jgi:hypothetical protein
MDNDMSVPQWTDHSAAKASAPKAPMGWAEAAVMAAGLTATYVPQAGQSQPTDRMVTVTAANAVDRTGPPTPQQSDVDTRVSVSNTSINNHSTNPLAPNNRVSPGSRLAASIAHNTADTLITIATDWPTQAGPQSLSCLDQQDLVEALAEWLEVDYYRHYGDT